MNRPAVPLLRDSLQVGRGRACADGARVHQAGSIVLAAARSGHHSTTVAGC
jgi:hypothetical protein